MVKANAYGHGLLQIVDYCFHHLSIKAFGVATLGEALALRRGSRNYEYQIYVFSDLALEDDPKNYLDFKLIPVLTRMDDFIGILKHEKCRHLPLCLKIETGMNRLGLAKEDIPIVIDELRKRERSLYHLMTHFSDSDIVEGQKTKRQYQRFLEIKSAFREARINVKETSASNSAAIENGVGLDETMIRPGLILYGIPSTIGLEKKCTVKPISSLKAEVLDRRFISKGEEIGYGSTPAPQEGKLCILGLGYGDGISNPYQRLPLEFGDFHGEIVGKINMDMIQAIFPKQTPIKPGDLVSIWSHSTEQFGRIVNHTKFIPYEITCLLNDRLPRLYINSLP